MSKYPSPLRFPTAFTGKDHSPAFAYTSPGVPHYCSPSVGSVSPTMIANASKTGAASSSLSWIPYGYIKGLIIPFIKKKKKRISKLQKHSQWDLYSIGSFRLQEQGRPIVLPLLMGVYCEDKQDADLAAAHTAGPHRELLVARHCPGWTWSSWPAMQLLSWLNSIPSLCLGSFTFKREMIIIPISLACWED